MLAAPLLFLAVLIASSIATPASAACTLPQTLTFTSINQTLVLDINACAVKPGVGYLGLHQQGEDINNYYGLGWEQALGDAADTDYTSNGATYTFRGRQANGSQSDGTLNVTLKSISSGALGATTIVAYTCDWDGATSCLAQDPVTINVNLNIPPITAAYTHAAQPYRSVAGGSINFSLAASVTGGSPTSYAVGASTTTGGGTVSIDNAGQVTYTQPVGRRGTDTFTYTATNAYGTSAPSTVTVPINNPVFTAVPPSATGNVGVAYNPGATPVAMSGGRAPYGSFSASGLPTGLTINSAGVISGTPSAVGTYNATITATDSSTGTGPYTSTAAITITISNTPPPVANNFAYGSIVAYNDGGNLPTVISVSGQVSGAPTNYAVGSATTAQGGSVSINSSGDVSYIPPAGYRNANDSFTYTASNAGGSSSPATVTVTIGDPTFMVSLPSPTATVGTAYNPGSTPVTITGGRAAYTVNSVSGLPAGLTQSGNAIIGTPTAQGSYTLTFNITDSSIGGGAYTSTAQAALTVVLPPAPVASAFTASAVGYNAGGASASTFSAAGNATNNPTSYAVGSAATAQNGSVSISNAGLVTYTPPVGFRGNDSFTFTATNQGGTSSPATVTVPVNNPTFAVVLPAGVGTVGVAYNPGAAPVTVSGGLPPYSSFSATGLPAGLTINSSGVISGVPTTAANATVTITATDSSTGTGPFTSTASAPLNIAAPVITLSPSSLPGATAGAAYSQTVTSTGGVAPVTYAVTSGSVPPGIMLASSGALSGTPTSAGSYTFTITGTDSSGNNYNGQQSYTLTVAPPNLSVSPGSLPAATVGAVYSQTLTASGGTAAYSFALSSGALPAGVNLSTGGVLSGTPTAGGVFAFDVTVTDSTGGVGAPFSANQSYTLSVNSPTIAISPSTLPNGAIAASVSQTLTASGGTAGYVYNVTAGSLPPGVSLSTGGVLSGAPTGAGTYNFSVTATDSSTGAGPFTGVQAYAWTIDAPTVAVSPATIANPTVGVPYAASVSASGGTATYSYAVTVGALPAGITLNAGSGALSGTPTAGGTFNFTITATDSSTGTGAPFSGSQTYTVSVGAPTVSVSPASPLPNATVGAAVSETITASGGTASYTFAITSGALPAGTTLSTTGALTGTPTAAGTFNFTVTATDSSTGAGPYSGSQTYSWTVGAPTITVSPASVPGAQIGASYNASVSASGGTASYGYAVTAGALPAGITLSTAGALTGTPTAAGVFNFTITATDSSTGVGAPFTGAQAYTMTVTAPTISVAPTTLSNAAAGSAYSETLTASGGTATYAYAVTAGALPAGLTLSPTGELSGTPTATGNFNFTVTATDSSTGAGAPFSGAQAYTLVVDLAALTISPATLPAATQEVAYAQTLITSGGVAPYAYALTTGALPAGLTLSPTGELAGTPTVNGSFSFSVTATDSSTGSGPATQTRAYTLVVNVPAPPTTGAVSLTVAANSTDNTVTPALSGTAATSVAVSTAPSHGVATVSGLTFLYTPTAGYSGVDSFSYTASNDGGASVPATVSITVSAPTLVVAGAVTAGTVAVAYPDVAFTATAGTAPYAFTAASLPPGLTLSPAGVLSGAPTTAGTFNAVVTATDAYGATGSETFPITIGAPMVTITSPAAGALPTATAFVAYSQMFTATGGAAPRTFAVTGGALPPGLTLSAQGEITGSATATGSYTFTVTPSDGSGAPGPYAGTPETYTLVVGAPAMTLSPAGVPNGVATVPYPSTTFSAAGGTAPYAYAITAGVLPDGLTLSAAGVLSGAATQTATGGFAFTVRATDANGFTVDRAYTLTIDQVTLVTASPAAAVAGQAYSQTLVTNGGTGPYAYSLAGGALPAGVSLGADGLLSGTPTAAGTFGFSVTATDTYGATGTDNLTLTVSNAVLSLSPTTVPAADWGVAYSQQFQASGGVAPYSYALTAGTLPQGLTLSSAGALSGAPSEEGTFAITVSATDSATGAGPFTTSVSLNLVVNAAPPPAVEPVATETPAGEPTTIDVSDKIDGFYTDVVIVDPPQHGTAVVTRSASRMRSQSGGTVQIVYTPNPGYFGPDSFTYAATGPGGTSAPAAISVAVAAPAPVAAADSATTNANAPVVIAVTTNDTGPISTIAIASAPTNGVATVSGLNVTYVPAANFFGTDTFTYTASGEGGTSAAATVTVTVNALAAPSQSAQVLTVLAGQSATLAATQGATGGPFTGVTIATAPNSGTATVNGETIVYTPTPGFAGPSDSFTYRISNPFGTSAPIPVSVTVNPAPLTAPPITIEILAGQKAVVNLVQGASGGPFTGAAVVSINPTGAGTATIAAPTAGAYTLTFTPDNAFAGTAVVSYTLSNAYATSAPGRINVIVTARPDPSQDAEVKGLVAAQDAAAIRFADAQISNFSRRLEQLHNGGGAGRGFGLSVRGGDTEREDGMEARERFRKYARLGLNDAADPSSLMLPAADQAGDAAEADGPDGQAGPKRWGVWAAGAADFGMRDAVGSQSGFRFTTDGLTAGVDYRVNPQFAFGVGLGYGRDSSRIGKSGTKSKAQSYSGGVYASLQPGEKTFVDGVLGYGTLDFDTRRYVTSTGELVRGERDGDQVFAALTFGFEHRTPASLLSPYGRVAFSRSQLNAFAETGGGPYGLTYHDQTVRSLTGTLGLRGEFNRKVSAGLLSPRFRVEYSHDFEDANDALLSYTDWLGGPIYRLAVDPIDRDQLRLELGADLTIRSGLRIGVDFDNMIAKDSDSQGVRITVQSPF